MNLLQVITAFLGQPSEWRLTNISGASFAALLGGQMKHFRYRHLNHDYGMTFKAVSVGVDASVSADMDVPRSWQAYNGKIYRRPLLGRELRYEDFVGMARTVTVGNLTIIAFGGPAAAISSLTCMLPPVALAAQVYGARAIAFRVEDSLSASATVALGDVKAGGH